MYGTWYTGHIKPLKGLWVHKAWPGSPAIVPSKPSSWQQVELKTEPPKCRCHTKSIVSSIGSMLVGPCCLYSPFWGYSAINGPVITPHWSREYRQHRVHYVGAILPKLSVLGCSAMILGTLEVQEDPPVVRKTGWISYPWVWPPPSQ